MALIAATIHRFTSFSMFPLIKQTGNIAWYLEIFLLAYAALFLSGWLVDRLRNLNRPRIHSFFSISNSWQILAIKTT